jgi:hypothetical protein
MDDDTAATDALAKRIAHLRKAYAKGLGHRPSTLQSAAIMRAAKLTAEAERALADPTVSINDKVRIDNAADRARRALDHKARAPAGPTLQDYVRRRRAEASAS